MQERMQENMFAELELTQLALLRVQLIKTEHRWHCFQNLLKIPMLCFIFGKTTLPLKRQKRSIRYFPILEEKIT